MIRAGLIAAAMLLALPAAAQQGAPVSGAAADSPQRPTFEAPEKKRPVVEPRGMAALIIDYPSGALRRREQGEVRLSMCVDKKGRPRDVRLVQSSGSEALDEASVKGAPGLRFKPGEDAAGKPIDWCDPPYVVTINWRLPP